MLYLSTNSKTSAALSEVEGGSNIQSLRIVEGPVIKYRNAALPEGKTVYEIIASYAFSIFGLASAPLSISPMFPNRFVLPVMPAHDKEKTDIAVELFHSIKRNHAVAAVGEVRENQVADYLCELGQADNDGVIAVSKIHEGQMMLFVYNSSRHDAVEKFIQLNDCTGSQPKTMRVLYGYESCGHISTGRLNNKKGSLAYVKLYLRPGHLVVLKAE